ncbi:hypothetical protein MASR1M60_19600 [Rhodocyclaceae bacterium]
MGYLYNGTCFTSIPEVSHAYYKQQGIQVTPGSVTYYTYYDLVGGTWKLKRYLINPAGTITEQTAVNAPVMTSWPYCDEAADKFIDGVTVGWGIVTAMAAAYAFRLMQKATT